jgi:dihydropteroate synthase
MSHSLTIRDRSFCWGKKTYIMGILNVTPDSFSDGGEFNNIHTALTQAQTMINNGVDIIDIGGQSTRPGAIQISLEDELTRTIPIIKAIRTESNIPISIDTTRAEVAKAAIKAGADIVNDISGGTFDPEMLMTVGELNVPIILMHIRGNPQNMQQLTDYEDLIGDIYNFLFEQIKKAIACGIKQHHIIIDPGIGFAKNHEQNLELIRNLATFKTLKCPLLIGISRKSFIGKILNQPNPKDRIWGTAAACSAAIFYGADILRVHDVQEMREIALVADAIDRN